MVLPKHMRLKGHRSFDFIYREGAKFYGPSMVLRVKKVHIKHQAKLTNIHKKPSIKCAISISNKVSKKSVTRNRIRRLFHQHLADKLSNIEVDEELWAFISLKPSGLKIATRTLLEECDKLLSKAGITK